MKRILSFIMMVVAAFVLGSSSANAEPIQLNVQPKEPIALFIQLDPHYVGKPLEITNELYDKFKEKLNNANKEPVEFAKAQKDLKVYIRDNDVNDNQRDQDKGAILRSKDLKALADKEGTRYVIVASTRVTSAEEKVNFWTGLRKNMTIMTNIVIYDAQENDYVMDEDYSSVGKTSGSYDRAFHRAIEDVLTKIDFNKYLK